MRPVIRSISRKTLEKCSKVSRTINATPLNVATATATQRIASKDEKEGTASLSALSLPALQRLSQKAKIEAMQFRKPLIYKARKNAYFPYFTLLRQPLKDGVSRAI